jgi:hypothetical protein
MTLPRREVVFGPAGPDHPWDRKRPTPGKKVPRGPTSHPGRDIPPPRKSVVEHILGTSPAEVHSGRRPALAGAEAVSYEQELRIRKHSRATPAGKYRLTLLAQQDFGNGVWALMENLAADMNLSHESGAVRKHLRMLRALGEVEVQERPGKSSKFKITLKCPDDCPDRDDHYPEWERTPVQMDRPQDGTPVHMDQGPRSKRTAIKTTEREASSSKRKTRRAGRQESPAARPGKDPLAQRIEAAATWETAHDDEDSAYWLARLLNSGGGVRGDTLAEWAAVGRGVANGVAVGASDPNPF